MLSGIGEGLSMLMSYLWRYIVATFFAVLIYALATLILRILLVTVQGPTLISSIIEAVVFYLSMMAMTFFLFRIYGKKAIQSTTWQLLLYPVIILLLHIVVALLVNTQTLTVISTGVSTLSELLYIGGGQILTSMEMPRVYYVIALTIQGICFIVFSFWGTIRYRKGFHK